MQDEKITETLSLIDEETSLPEGWRLVSLGDVCTLQRGYDLPRQNWIDGSYPIVGSNGIIGFHNEFMAKSPGVVTGRSGTIGKVHYIDSDFFPHNTSLYVKDFKGNNPKFIKYLLESIDLKSLGEQTTAVPSLDRKNAHKVKVLFPTTIEEQRRIASVLDEQMKAVEQARLAIEEQRTAANLLPNAFLRVVFESEEAQNWQKRKLGEIAKTCSGSTPSRSNPDYYKGSISWVKTGELKDGLILETEEHISELALKESSVRLLPPETLLVAMYGQGKTRGRTGLLKLPATTNQACFAILPNETFDSYFLQYWFRHNYQRLRQETEGRGGNQPNLNGEVLNNQIVSLPIEVNEQSKFVKKINEQMQAAETLKKSLTEKLEAVKKLPAALLRKAFAGEI